MKQQPSHRRGPGGFLAALTLGATLVVAGPALALDKSDIYGLQAAGLNADVIVSVIRSSTEPMEFTPEDVEEMRQAGIPQPVLDEISMRIGYSPGGGGGGQTGGWDSGPDLQQELERQRQLEEQRRQLEMERMQEEQQRMREQVEREQEREEEVQTAYEGLTRASRLYRNGEYARAGAVYRRFLDEVAPAPDTPEYYEALFGYVQSMYRAGYRFLIRTEALEVTLMGSDREHFEDAFRILADISNEVQYSVPSFEELTGLSIQNLDADFQDEFNYFMGRTFRNWGEADRALEFLSRVSDDSDRAGQAHYLSAIILLEQQENRRAVQEFQAAVETTESNESDSNVSELAYLALARIAYEIGNFDGALYYYHKIPDSSFRHVRAIFESMWTYFLKQDFDRAMGAIHALSGPYYDAWFFPELYVVEAASYLMTCNLEDAELAIEAFDEEVSALLDPTQEFVINATSPDLYWEAMTQWYDRAETSDPVGLPIEAVRYVMQQPDYIAYRDLIGSLEDEAERLADDSDILEDLAETGALDIETTVQTKRIEAGLRIAELVREFASDLTDWRVKAQEVGIEVTSERLEATREARSTGLSTGGEVTSVFVLAQDWQYWPWEGEYWIDEIDNFRGELRDLRDPDSGVCTIEDLPL